MLPGGGTRLERLSIADLGGVNAWFPDEAACLAYLARLRWSRGLSVRTVVRKELAACPAAQLRCASCRREISITAGTVFADSHLPLMSWFAAAWYVTSRSRARVRSVCNGCSGWAAYAPPGRCCTSSDGRWSGRAVSSSRASLRSRDDGRGWRARQDGPWRLWQGDRRDRVERSRARLRARPPRPHPNCSERVLTNFVLDVRGARLGRLHRRWQGYSGLASAGFQQPADQHRRQRRSRHVAMPRLHRVSALLNAGCSAPTKAPPAASISTTTSRVHLPLQPPPLPPPRLVFYRLLEQAMQIDHVPISHLSAAKS